MVLWMSIICGWEDMEHVEHEEHLDHLEHFEHVEHFEHLEHIELVRLYRTDIIAFFQHISMIFKILWSEL